MTGVAGEKRNDYITQSGQTAGSRFCLEHACSRCMLHRNISLHVGKNPTALSRPDCDHPDDWQVRCVAPLTCTTRTACYGAAARAFADLFSAVLLPNASRISSCVVLLQRPRSRIRSLPGKPVTCGRLSSLQLPSRSDVCLLIVTYIENPLVRTYQGVPLTNLVRPRRSQLPLYSVVCACRQ